MAKEKSTIDIDQLIENQQRTSANKLNRFECKIASIFLVFSIDPFINRFQNNKKKIWKKRNDFVENS